MSAAARSVFSSPTVARLVTPTDRPVPGSRLPGPCFLETSR